MAPRRSLGSRSDCGSPEEQVRKLRARVDVERSFHCLFVENFYCVEGYFRQQRCSPQEAEDLSQETFTRAYQGLRDFRGDASIKTWLLSVARNVWLNHVRDRAALKRAAKEIPLDDIELGEDELRFESKPAEMLEELLRTHQRKVLVEGLRRLPDQMRKVIFLRVFQDKKYHEIAAVLQVSIQTVRSQLFHARRRLIDNLEA